jgi:hypothetical protein
MDTPLPSNDALIDFSSRVPWQEIEAHKLRFNDALAALIRQNNADTLPLEALSNAVGAPVASAFDPDSSDGANLLYSEIDGHRVILGGVVSSRYRSGKRTLESIVPFNMNPSVNHTNLHETDDTHTRIRPMGAEIEMGLVHASGEAPGEDEMQRYIQEYYKQAGILGIYPHLDREACQYQIEAHIAPTVGYNATRLALNNMLMALVRAADATGLRTLILSCYPTASDFKLADDPKVWTATDLMLEVNALFPEYADRLAAAKNRYHIDDPAQHHVNVFRNQGCHIHIDLAGRSEALGLFTFYTMLHSASAVANAAVLKGGPFMNGTCDPELLCVREYLRATTVTGRILDLPTSPHLTPGGFDAHADLLRTERVNSPARAMLVDSSLGQLVSVMHNPIGRVRPDLRTAQRICTIESTGMPTHISASRVAAVLTDFEFSHAIMEDYFRKHGCDLAPMQEDRAMWSLLGPLDRATFVRLSAASDRECTDMTITTATGDQMTLADFYEKKRRFMHRALDAIMEITPRDIDEVYTSLSRMIDPPSGRSAQTIAQYISDPKLRSTGNWGRILRDAYVEAGGTPGAHHPEAVLAVVNQIHDAMVQRWL